MAMSLAPTKIINKAKLGVKGPLGFVLATVAIEFGTQALEAFILARNQRALAIANHTVLTGAPFLGTIDTRDVAVLSPSIFEGFKIITTAKNKGAHFVNAALGYITKAAMRQTGLNPLPDRHDPNKHEVKSFSYQLPSGY